MQNRIVGVFLPTPQAYVHLKINYEKCHVIGTRTSMFLFYCKKIVNFLLMITPGHENTRLEVNVSSFFHWYGNCAEIFTYIETYMSIYAVFLSKFSEILTPWSILLFVLSSRNLQNEIILLEHSSYIRS